MDPFAPRNPLGQGRRRQADPGAQLEHVHRAEHLAEQAGDTGTGVDLGGQHLQQGGLAGAVGSDHHPAVLLVDPQGEVVDQRGPASDDGHPGEVSDSGHAPNLQVAGRRSGPPRVRRTAGGRAATEGRGAHTVAA